MQRPRQGQVIIGVDTHKEIHVAAAVDRQGTLVGEERFPTTRQATGSSSRGRGRWATCSGSE